MASSSDCSPLDLQKLLATLESKSSTEAGLLEALNALGSHLKEGDPKIFDRDIVKHGTQLMSAAKRHLQSSKGGGGLMDGIQQKSLVVIGYLLSDKEVINMLPLEEPKELLTLLEEVATETTEKVICSHALWCVSRQKFSHSDVALQLPSLVKALNKAASVWWGKAIIVEHACLQAILRLYEQCEKEMSKLCGEWLPLLLKLLVSGSAKVQKDAMDSVKKWMPLLSHTVASNKDCFKLATVVMAESIEPELLRAFREGRLGADMWVLKVCNILLLVFRHQISHGPFINSILSVLEAAFKRPSDDTRGQAFRSWQILIDIFAERNILSEPKYMSLLMSVFKTRNTSTVASTTIKLGCWWHYVRCLGSQSLFHFDKILKPLLQFCLGNPRLGSDSVQGTPITPRRITLKSISPSGSFSPNGEVTLKTFPEIRRCGLESLAYMLQISGKSPGPSIKFTLEPVKSDFNMTPGIFLKNATVLISSLLELTRTLEFQPNETLLMYTWECAAAQMRMALDTTTSGSERHETVTLLLGEFQVLVLSQDLPPHFLLKIFQLICTFPAKVLSSTAYSIRRGGTVNSCPAQFLLEVLLTPKLLKSCDCQESFMTVFLTLVGYGSSQLVNMLVFCQRVTTLLDGSAQFVSSGEVLWRLWSIVASALHEHILKTNEVNQGDSLEYNFDCLYAVLMLPITHRLPSRLPLPVNKSLVKTWIDLYRTFARLSAIVTNAEANAALEELSRKILETVTPEDYIKDGPVVESLLEMCHTMVQLTDFSSLSSTNPFMVSLGTPSSSSKKSRQQSGHKVLGNLPSFVLLFGDLVRWAMELLRSEGEKIMEKPPFDAGCHNAVAMINLIVDTASTLAIHLSVPSLVAPVVERLAAPLSAILSASSRKTPAKVFSPALLQKVEKLWQELCALLQSHYKSSYGSDLGHVAPLLQAAFTHSRRNIKAQTVQLWNTTFGLSATLAYPDDLQAVLAKVKEKTSLLLPGWSSSGVTVIDETPLSQLSQTDLTAPEPILPGIPGIQSVSPVRVRGSILNRDVSPSPVKGSSPSPSVKRFDPCTENRVLFGGSSARKKLAIDLLSDKDFVVIADTHKKKRVLTEHQKEMMKEKRVIPAMYNNLDASQDVSLLAHFSSETTQQDGLLPAQEHSQPSDVIVIPSSQSQEPQGTSDSGSVLAVKPEFPALHRSSRRRTVCFQDEVAKDQPAEKTDPQEIQPQSSSGENKLLTNTGTHRVLLKSVSFCDSSILGKESPSLQDEYEVTMHTPQANLLAAANERLVESLSGGDKEPGSSSRSASASLQSSLKDPDDTFFRPFKSVGQGLSQALSSGAETSSCSSDSIKSALSLALKTPSEDKLLVSNMLPRRSSSRKFHSQEILPSHASPLESGSTTRKTRSQESAKHPSHPKSTDYKKHGKELVSLDRWLKNSAQTSAEAEKNVDEGTRPNGELRSKKHAENAGAAFAFASGSLRTVAAPVTVVEETQSLEKISAQDALPTSFDCSAVHSPSEVSCHSKTLQLENRTTKGVAGSDCAKDTDTKGWFRTAILALPILQLEKLSPAQLPPTDRGSNPAFSTGDAKESAVDFNKEPPELCEEMASQGFECSETDEPPELELSQSVATVTEESPVIADSMPGRNDDSLDHHATLFGFAELLDEEKKTEEANKTNEVEAVEEQTENSNASIKLTTVKGSEAVEFDSQLNNTLRTTPSDCEQSLSAGVSDLSQSQQATTGRVESKNRSSPEHMVEAINDFDPSSPTLNSEKPDHAKKRKQLVPKKITEQPNVLRRTPRKSKGKAVRCACCRDGDGSRHRRSSSTLLQGSKWRQSSSSSPQASPVQKKSRKSLCQESCPSQSPEAKVQTCRSSNDELEQASLEEEKPKSGLGPQELGEKTPETKTSSTPLRQSTTKKKKEAAVKRRAISRAFGFSPCKLSSDSESDCQPLSQLKASSDSKMLLTKTIVIALDSDTSLAKMSLPTAEDCSKSSSRIDSDSDLDDTPLSKLTSLVPKSVTAVKFLQEEPILSKSELDMPENVSPSNLDVSSAPNNKSSVSASNLDVSSAPNNKSSVSASNLDVSLITLCSAPSLALSHKNRKTRLALKKSGKQRATTTTIRSPPKLRLRQKKSVENAAARQAKSVSPSGCSRGEEKSDVCFDSSTDSLLSGVATVCEEGRGKNALTDKRQPTTTASTKTRQLKVSQLGLSTNNKIGKSKNVDSFFTLPRLKLRNRNKETEREMCEAASLLLSETTKTLLEEKNNKRRKRSRASKVPECNINLFSKTPAAGRQAKLSKTYPRGFFRSGKTILALARLRGVSSHSLAWRKLVLQRRSFVGLAKKSKSADWNTDEPRRSQRIKAKLEEESEERMEAAIDCLESGTSCSQPRDSLAADSMKLFNDSQVEDSDKLTLGPDSASLFPKFDGPENVFHSSELPASQTSQRETLDKQPSCSTEDSCVGEVSGSSGLSAMAGHDCGVEPQSCDLFSVCDSEIPDTAATGSSQQVHGLVMGLAADAAISRDWAAATEAEMEPDTAATDSSLHVHGECLVMGLAVDTAAGRDSALTEAEMEPKPSIFHKERTLAELVPSDDSDMKCTQSKCGYVNTAVLETDLSPDCLDVLEKDKWTECETDSLNALALPNIFQLSSHQKHTSSIASGDITQLDLSKMEIFNGDMVTEMQKDKSDESSVLEEGQSTPVAIEDYDLFPLNQEGLELEDEEDDELSSASLQCTRESIATRSQNTFEENGIDAAPVDSLGNDSLSENAVTSEKGPGHEAEDQLLRSQDVENDPTECFAETSSEGEGAQRHVSVQTSPETCPFPVPASSSHKMTIEEILEIIAESDVSSEDVIAALQQSTKKPCNRGLFEDSPINRGMQMLQRSLQRSRQTKLPWSSPQPASISQSSCRLDQSSTPPRNKTVISLDSSSPTGSILKKRSVEGSDNSEESTPNKKRRVSFADPLITGESPAHEATLHKIPDYFHTTLLSGVLRPRVRRQIILEKKSQGSGEVSRGQRDNKQGADALLTNTACGISDDAATTSTPKDSISQSSGTPVSQNTYQSTDESQLNERDPLYPALLHCTESVHLLLPQLTSPAWHRGLCQLMTARGLTTVGDLAALTEVDICAMPIKPPKVDNVRKAMARFLAKWVRRTAGHGQASGAAGAEATDSDTAAGNGPVDSRVENGDP